jgi:hypothetical protein
MCDLIDRLDLATLLKRAGIEANNSDFEALYDSLASSGQHPDIVSALEDRVRQYFSRLALPEEATLYDCLVLSLREKDLIASFNWDPFLALAWQRNSTVVKLPRIVFLHGNVEVAACTTHRVKNFRGNDCSKCRTPLSPTRLLFPVKHKDYNRDPFIASEWHELRTHLKHAYFLTIFGYAAPDTDVEAKDLLLGVWKENPTFELAEVDIIDIKAKRELESTWKQFFCRQHYYISRSVRASYLFTHPRRSCEAFAMATLQNAPWRDNPVPKIRNLRRLQEWARLLWIEETTGRLSGKTCEELAGSRKSGRSYSVKDGRASADEER